jgi:hypothetical protein
VGFQTKKQMKTKISEKFGSNLAGLQDKAGNSIKDWKKQNGQFQKFKQDAKNVKQAKSSAKTWKNINKPSFKVNPLRGRPFIERISPDVSVQTSKRSDFYYPNLLTTSTSAIFKHTPKLNYSLGIISTINLGTGWSSSQFKVEGLGYKTSATWTWSYGISSYLGYERLFKLKKISIPENVPYGLNSHNTQHYSESFLLGLNKAYRLTDKWNGNIQILYDIWWKEKQLNSPIQIRFSTNKK